MTDEQRLVRIGMQVVQGLLDEQERKALTQRALAAEADAARSTVEASAWRSLASDLFNIFSWDDEHHRWTIHPWWEWHLSQDAARMEAFKCRTALATPAAPSALWEVVQAARAYRRAWEMYAASSTGQSREAVNRVRDVLFDAVRRLDADAPGVD